MKSLYSVSGRGLLAKKLSLFVATIWKTLGSWLINLQEIYIATRKVPMQKTCHADTEKTSDYLISLLADACLTFLRVREVKRRVYIAAKKCQI